MARPLLADAFFVTKAAAGQADRINTCIACNQACLDHAFKDRTVSCLVNPRAGHERDLVIAPTTARKRIAVVGAGPAGLAAATTLAERGHEVDLFDAADEIGGQFNLAKRIPGKEEFHETLRYFANRIEDTGVRLHLSTRVSAEDLAALGVDEVVLATGVTPRDPHIPGQDGSNVVSYIDVLAGGAPVGERVAIVGAGGIGFDVAEFLVVAPGESPTLDLAEWRREWGVGDPADDRGGLVKAQPVPATRKVTLLQRKRGKLGAGLGKTTGWIHRSSLVAKGVTMLPGVNYERITPEGLVVSFGEKHEREHLVEADTIVLCAGQEPLRELEPTLVAAGIPVHVIGGAARGRRTRRQARDRPGHPGGSRDLSPETTWTVRQGGRRPRPPRAVAPCAPRTPNPIRVPPMILRLLPIERQQPPRHASGAGPGRGGSGGGGRGRERGARDRATPAREWAVAGRAVISDLDGALADQHRTAADPHAGHLAADPVDPRLQDARAAHLHPLGDPPRPLAVGAVEAGEQSDQGAVRAACGGVLSHAVEWGEHARPQVHAVRRSRRPRTGGCPAWTRRVRPVAESGLIGACPLERRAVRELSDDELQPDRGHPRPVPVRGDVLRRQSHRLGDRRDRQLRAQGQGLGGLQLAPDPAPVESLDRHGHQPGDLLERHHERILEGAELAQRGQHERRPDVRMPGERDLPRSG